MYTEEEKEMLLVPDFVPVKKNAFHFLWTDHIQDKFHLVWDQEERVWTVCDQMEDELYAFLEEIKETTVIKAPEKYIEGLGNFSNAFLARWNKKAKTWTVPVMFAEAAKEALGVS